MMKDYYKEGKLEFLLDMYNINSLDEIELVLKKAKAFELLKELLNEVFTIESTIYDNKCLLKIKSKSWKYYIDINEYVYALLKEVLK